MNLSNKKRPQSNAKRKILRINKFISHNSNFSRREADELIKNGFVRINAKVAQHGDSVGENDKVRIKGKILSQRSKFSLIIYHKPKGELVSRRDERGRRVVYDSLPREFRAWRSVGRLDYASSGLLLLSDSPVIATALMKSDLEREYYLKIQGAVGENVCEAMQGGVEISGIKGAHAKSKITKMTIAPFLDYEIFGASGGYTKLRVVIGEGQNRELRRFFAHFDLKVVDLKRVAFGILELGVLKEGKFRYLTKSEYDKLRDFLRENGVRY